MNLKPLDDFIEDLEKSDTSGRATRDKRRQVLLRNSALTARHIAEELKVVRGKLAAANKET